MNTAITIIFGTVLIILAAAVVLLFAMLGALAARLPEEGTEGKAVQRGSSPSPEGYAVPMDDAPIGRRPQFWPKELGSLSNGPTLLAVLSTACGSCRDVADQLPDFTFSDPAWRFGLVVSSVDADRAAKFVRDHDLARVTRFVDEGGTWTMQHLGLDKSPSAVVIRDGQVVAGYMFNELSLLLDEVFKPSENAWPAPVDASLTPGTSGMAR